MQTVCNTYWDAGKGNLTAQNTRKPSAPDPAEGVYSAPANPIVGGEGLAVPPQEPHPPLSALWASPLLRHSKISCDAIVREINSLWKFNSYLTYCQIKTWNGISVALRTMVVPYASLCCIWFLCACAIEYLNVSRMVGHWLMNCHSV